MTIITRTIAGAICAASLILAPVAQARRAAPVPQAPPPSLAARVAAKLNEAPPGTRFGLVVTSEDGREIIAINPDGRFIPASNTKIVTTATALATLGGTDQPDPGMGTAIRLAPAPHGASDVVLEGAGDARLSSADACVTDCLAQLADAVAARTRKVRDVIGDDRLYPDERWSQGMSWNNIPTRSGTAVSALTLDDNELPLVVTPGATPGARPGVTLSAYYTLDNQLMTVASGATAITVDRLPGSMTVRLTGTIAVGAAPDRDWIGIDEPAHYAAWRLREMLVARGVKVTGTIAARHRRPGSAVEPTDPAAPVARLVAPPLSDDLTIINKTSQNLHAELLLRRVGRAMGEGTTPNGLARVTAVLSAAGLPRTAFDFSDGSGMSTYNRIAPRAMVRLLRWIAVQPWGAQWRATLPIGGEGMLARRFAGTTLDHRIFAKTGTLNATNALSGYVVAASGQKLTFASFANDVPDGARVTPLIDAALMMIAAEN